MTDGIERRLRAADPAGPASSSYRPDDSCVRKLMEKTPNTSVTEGSRGRAWWLPAAAAAASVSVLGVAAFALLAGNEDPSALGGPESSMELTLPGSDVMASCVRYSVGVLADMPTAFSGRAVEVREDTVVLEVDKWYRGGDAEAVELVTPRGDQVSLSGVVDFAEGRRYLVTAAEGGTVNACGFTAEWSPELAADFEEGFLGGRSR